MLLGVLVGIRGTFLGLLGNWNLISLTNLVFPIAPFHRKLGRSIRYTQFACEILREILPGLMVENIRNSWTSQAMQNLISTPEKIWFPFVLMTNFGYEKALPQRTNSGESERERGRYIKYLMAKSWRFIHFVRIVITSTMLWHNYWSERREAINNCYYTLFRKAESNAFNSYHDFLSLVCDCEYEI